MDWIPKFHNMPIPDEDGAIVGTKKVIFDYYARFSDEEKAQLQSLLNKYPANSVEKFIALLTRACNDYRVFFKQKRDHIIRHDIIDSLPVLKKALMQTKILQGQGPFVEQTKSVPGPDRHEREHFDYSRHIAVKSGVDVSYLARESAKYLEALIQLLEELQPNSPGKGRPSSEGGFAQAVNDIFKDCFEEQPSLWREGPIALILKICLEGMGLKSEDPERRLNSIKT